MFLFVFPPLVLILDRNGPELSPQVCEVIILTLSNDEGINLLSSAPEGLIQLEIGM